MKKLLLSCFLALGIGATAQITVNEDFEIFPVPNFAVTGGFQPNVYSDGGCGGTNSGIGSNIYGTSAANKTVNIIYTKPAAIPANGKKIDISFDYSTIALGGASVGGTITVAYIKANTGTTFTTIGTATIPAGNPDAVCASFTGSIPESANVNGQFRLRIQAVTANAANDFYFFADNVKIIQETLTPPACATVTLPSNGVNPNNGISVNWPTVGGASGYKVYVGTSTGNYDLVPGTVVTSTKYALTGLAASTAYFVKIVPTNSNGDATGCTEGTFTTGAVNYCDDVSSSASDQANFEKISNVNFAGIDNSSTSTSGYEDFTADAAILGTVQREKDYPIAITVSGFDSDLTSVWIDYNQDKIFSESEKVVLTPTAIATGTITIPSDALLGNTRMRVRTSYVTSPPACGAVSYGQGEDYTILVKEAALATSQVSTSRVSVYPNPFTDVLKISDVKGVQSITVNDISGRQVKSLAPSAELNLSSLKAGLYIVNVKMEDGSVKSFKAIKK